MSVIAKNEYEKLPKIGSTKEINDCVVPFIENKIEIKNEEATKKFSKCIPNDLIVAFKQAEQPKEYIGPPNKKTLNGIKPTNPSVIKRPDNAWNFEKQREKFKFLTEQPICSCGAGKDMSFIYDSVLQSKNLTKPFPSKYDISAIRASNSTSEQQIQIPDTLIPDEFKIAKNQGVWPLKVEENNFTALTEDHLNHVTTFPSLKPVGRNEVIQLKHTMDALLKRVGADIIDQKGPTQLHNLLEIIKQEQDIYNIIFHEVIRQVTVECKERGEILSKLRERYANLLSRVPREIKSLHEEVVAQRALDRRLTEELMEFKSTINYLTDELSYVKEHDKQIAEQAAIYQKDLKKALEDAEKNASLLAEYHELYELQRKRLEAAIKSIIDERDLWIKTSYSIAYKVVVENKLSTAKRLNIAEKSWSKQGKHFALLQSDRDTKDVIEIQKLIENWKESLNELRNEIVTKERDLKRSIEKTRNDLIELKKYLKQNTFDDWGELILVPDFDKVSNLFSQTKKILDTVAKDSELFNGDSVLLSEEKLKKGERILFSFVQLCNRVASRHEPVRDLKKYQEFKGYETLNTDIKLLHDHYRNRTSGDNGVSKSLNTLSNILDLWQQKMSSQIISENSKGKVRISESEWTSFFQALDECMDLTYKTENAIGQPLKEGTDGSPNGIDHPEIRIIDHDDLINNLHRWMAAFSHYVDSQDAHIVEEVNNIHTKMIHWMVQALIRLAPDREDMSEEAKRIVYDSTSTVDVLEKIGSTISEKLEKFSIALADRCNNIITEEENTRKANEESKYEKEFQNLQVFKSEVKEWNYVVKLLIAELNGDKSHRKA
ncbi:unnamed protein product, partial [Brachionus calyciflorus]